MVMQEVTLSHNEVKKVLVLPAIHIEQGNGAFNLNVITAVVLCRKTSGYFAGKKEMMFSQTCAAYVQVFSMNFIMRSAVITQLRNSFLII
jgi:hypothetical protein